MGQISWRIFCYVIWENGLGSFCFTGAGSIYLDENLQSLYSLKSLQSFIDKTFKIETARQKNHAKLSSFIKLENEMVSYHAL